MSNYLNTHILLIDTKLRDKKIKAHTNTNFVIRSDGVNKQTVKKIKLISIEFPSPYMAPVLYYNFEGDVKNNNSFVIIINTVEYIVSIKNNFYDIVLLIEEINKMLSKTIIDNGLVDITLSITLSVDKKCIFNCTSDKYVEICFEKHRYNNNSYDSLGKSLGFLEDSYKIDQTTPGSTGSAYIKNSLTIATEYITISYDDYFYVSIGNGGTEFTGNIESIKSYSDTNKLDSTSHTFVVSLSNTCDTKYVTREIIMDKPINLNNILVRLYNSKGNLINLTYINYLIILELSLLNNA